MTGEPPSATAPETGTPHLGNPPCARTCSTGGASRELDAPFSITITGFGVGAFWALAGVAIGRWTSRR